MQVRRLAPGQPLWQALAEYAAACPWEAGPHLARMMQEGAFAAREAVFAALAGGSVVGFCTLMEKDYYPENRYSPWISTVFVDEAFRGRGVCGLLVEGAAEYAREQGFRRVYIPSEHTGLYERYGFAKIDELENYGGDVDSIFARDILAEEGRPMEGTVVYHVVTERPMRPGQHILFDQDHHNVVYARVMDKWELVEKIYADPAAYEGADLDHHTKVALRELAMEEVRQRRFPQYPSRMACLFVSETLGEAEDWAAFFANDCRRPTYHIVRLRVHGRLFAGDACNCFDGAPDKEENLRLAENYWRNGPNGEDRPVKELLAAGDILVEEIVREINKNI